MWDYDAKKISSVALKLGRNVMCFEFGHVFCLQVVFVSFEVVEIDAKRNVIATSLT